MNLLIFQNVIEFFPLLLSFWKCWKWTYWRIVDVFVPEFHVTYNNYLSDETNSCTVIAPLFFQKRYFENVKKKFLNSYGSEKWINLFQMKKKDKLPDYLLNSYFVYQFVHNFSALLLCQINILHFLDLEDFFKFFLHREILKFRSNQTVSWEYT